jgi:hypothetical protein
VQDTLPFYGSGWLQYHFQRDEDFEGATTGSGSRRALIARNTAGVSLPIHTAIKPMSPCALNGAGSQRPKL